MQTYLMAFVIGGLICVLGQLLMDLTPLTPAHVLVLFVVLGGVLSGLGLYQPLVDIAGAGATVPLPGFGHSLVSGTIEEINKVGLWGIFTGAVKATAAGITAAIVFALAIAIVFDPKG
ncbi:SpoVA protein [Sporomusa ovata DSM 2662]|uniref:Stage V sporulation protein AE (SpoVAE) n=1 Tax=Sporomusa ovata TaxID=2378 RepID=A0A0U1L356_9FIRM|nr:stage V sporulation protein AE [Sporomusa ovata]EQB25526.1 stage V sporulation protein AE [Sporomusa ovata DSM 2662]CQR74090.1 Stage V sporulation protein AE (SpoVAE) [Sporomusa ovata]